MRGRRIDDELFPIALHCRKDKFSAESEGNMFFIAFTSSDPSRMPSEVIGSDRYRPLLPTVNLRYLKISEIQDRWEKLPGNMRSPDAPQSTPNGFHYICQTHRHLPKREVEAPFLLAYMFGFPLGNRLCHLPECELDLPEKLQE